MLSRSKIYIKILQYKNEKQSGPYIQNKNNQVPKKAIGSLKKAIGSLEKAIGSLQDELR
jgi:hypothetical protein